MWIYLDMVLHFAHLVEVQISFASRQCLLHRVSSALFVCTAWTTMKLCTTCGVLFQTEECFQNVPKAHLYETTQTHSYIGEYILEAHYDTHCG